MDSARRLSYAAALGMLALAGCQTVQDVLNPRKPTVRMTGLKFEDVRLDSANILFDVEVENPYSVPLPLLNMDYGLSTGSNRFLSGNAELQTTISAHSTEAVSLPARIDYLQVLKALGGIRPGAKIPYSAELELSLDTPVLGRIRLPLKKEGDLLLPTVSGADIGDIFKIIRPN